MNQRLTKPQKINIIQEKEPPQRYKIIVIGDAAVGKSCIIDRFIKNTFDDHYNPTIAVDYKYKSINLNKDTTIHINFWDFSGHPEFTEVRNEFYKESTIIALVFDVTLKRSLDGLDMWLREANDYGAASVPVVVIANKKDQTVKRVISESDGQNWARSRNYAYYEVSALTGQNIEDSFTDIIKKQKQSK